jgi:pimeloyl-ACP methyl ester carboxylesterase
VPAGFESKFANVNGVRIHYVTGGHGPALILLHGWPETWYEWRNMLPILAKDFTIVAPDLRGMGDSSLEPSGYDKKTLAQDVHALVTQLKLSKPILVGHDWGGPVAYAYAAQYRNELERLIMIEGLPFGPWLKTTNLTWFFNFFRIPGYAESLLPGREREC